MTRLTRRTAVSLGAASLVVATAQVVSALPSEQPVSELLPGEQEPANNLDGAVPSLLSSVPVEGQSLALSLEFIGGKAETLTDGGRTRATAQDLPASLVLANNGREPVPAGTRVVVRSAGLDIAGLVTGAKQPVLVCGVNSDANDWLAVEQENIGTVLTLRQVLPSGSALTVDVAWGLSSGTALKSGSKVQVLASAVLVASSSNYYEAQAPEVVLSL